MSALGCVAAEPVMYTNPIEPDWEDPWVVQHDGMYYYTFSSGPNHTGEYSRRNAVWVTGSPSLIGVCTAEPALAWAPEPGTMYSEELWAPELHWYNGAWYLYIAADDGNNDNHRTHVLRRTDAGPLGRTPVVSVFCRATSRDWDSTPRGFASLIPERG
jgi:GH43 family beta-xylosidase